MDTQETAQRLQETAAKCLSSLNAWNDDLKNMDARETLLEAVHELRKVTSRLEIDIALNDRKVVNAKPIPVPEHKSKIEKKKQKPLSEILPIAEIRDANEKRKIEIKNAQDDHDNDLEQDMSDDSENDQNDASNQGDSSKNNAPTKGRGRRKPYKKKAEASDNAE